jgi:branched-chain amino acid transport system ATP-binding protein
MTLGPATPSTKGSASPVLETRGLVKRFGGLLATDNVSIELRPGELHALIGPNGAGKTTLISQLTGELRPDQGDILMAGQNVNHLNVEKRAQLGLARSYQITQILPDFTALENVAMAILAKRNQAEARSGLGAWKVLIREAAIQSPALAALKQVGLEGQAGIPAKVMAHGEHRQLELAMALALQPRLLLLDEPLAGMSGGESETMIELLLSLKGRYPILLVEHDMNAVFKLADRVSVLVYGKVIASGTPEQIKNDAEVRQAYLGDDALVA